MGQFEKYFRSYFCENNFNRHKNSKCKFGTNEISEIINFQKQFHQIFLSECELNNSKKNIIHSLHFSKIEDFGC